MSDEYNPYQAPEADLGDAPVEERAIVLVGTGRRFLNYVVDFIACQVIQFAILIGLVAVAGTDVQALTERPVGFLLGVSVMVGYYVAMESMFQRTLGKLVTGTVVVDETGGRPTLGQIVKRSFCRLVPFEPFSCFGDRSVGWHDSWSQTRVVRA